MIDGGPAFPGIETRINGLHEQHRAYYGMTLRDWFAGMAMQGALATGYKEGAGRMDWHYMLSTGAYQIADAMLKAREAGDE
jgi:hypothetical protein